jgi:hypothetical protein
MKEIINKYKWYAVGIISLLIFFSAKSCIRTQIDELHGKNKQLEVQIKKLKDGVTTLEARRLRTKDSINSENDKRRKERKELEKKVLASAERIKQLERDNSKTKSKIKNMSLEEKAKELNDTYGSKDATATANSIDIRGSMPNLILETIADADTCSEIVKEKDSQLVIKDSLNSSLSKDKNALLFNLFSAEKSIKGFKELNQIQEEFNTSLEKENKKIRVKNTLNTILIPVVAVISIYGGYKLAK